ncbi:amino acid ABC transporter substrate-binding protein [Oceanospirillum sediminis]|uniref:Amino acid ABC transporter substrate-binding protein n=1 Tax=Oceanospirillum sediminis TaxID=2760088 RepID=A0A839IR51_9GAMM|nr:amino acid ABC transporter substrate-binding protein [Oceanospirillum sediminis]MBB1486917.1 amino acid ABC transporter substrate-binding protein [Oceanospirillum sediminis]
MYLPGFRRFRSFLSGSAIAGLCLFSVSALGTADGISTLKKVQQRGDLNCGVFPDDPGRSAINSEGHWQGFYVDFCKGVAAAVLHNPDYVRYIEVGAKSRFTSLIENKTDVVMYSSTWTLGREYNYAVNFPAIYLFDGQGFIVRKSSGIQSLEDLEGKTVCATENTTSYQNLADMLKGRDINAKVVSSNGDSFFRGSCDAYTADRMNLATNRANRATNPDDYLILPESISREPIGPKVRNNDPQWERIVRAVVHAVILAEEKGITAQNTDQILKHSRDAETLNLLGVRGNIGKQLGLDNQWAYRVIQAIGNYGEIYNRHFGPDTPIGMERGLNQLWSKGGVLFAPPFK